MYQEKKEDEDSSALKTVMDTSIQGLKIYIKKRKERLFTATSINTDNIKTNRTTKTTKQKCKEKQLYGYIKRQTSEIGHKREDLEIVKKR